MVHYSIPGAIAKVRKWTWKLNNEGWRLTVRLHYWMSLNLLTLAPLDVLELELRLSGLRLVLLELCLVLLRRLLAGAGTSRPS